MLLDLTKLPILAEPERGDTGLTVQHIMAVNTTGHFRVVSRESGGKPPNIKPTVMNAGTQYKLLHSVLPLDLGPYRSEPMAGFTRSNPFPYYLRWEAPVVSKDLAKNTPRQWVVGIRIEVGPFERDRDLAAVIVQDCTSDNPVSLFGVVLRVSAARAVLVRLTEESLQPSHPSGRGMCEILEIFCDLTRMTRFKDRPQGYPPALFELAVVRLVYGTLRSWALLLPVYGKRRMTPL